MCSNSKSQFRGSSPEALQSFSFSAAFQELSDSAPLLLAVLRACATNKLDTIDDEQNNVVTAAACLLKNHHPLISCLPYLVSISLYHSGAKKELYKRLNEMGLSMSHRMTLIKVGQLAEQCDKDVCKWKSDVEENSERHEVPYQITGDNLDLQIQTKVMSLSRQNKSLHWFNMVATQERVQSPVFSDQEPRPSIMALSPKKFLPSTSDDEHLRKEFTVLVTRVLCHNL